MPTAHVEVSEQNERLDEAVADYLRGLHAGHPVPRSEFLAAHADLADNLESFFANLDRIEQVAGPLRGLVDPAFGSARHAGLPEMGRRFGDYELLEEIARGGMGVVYRARQVKLNRIVAVKMILAGQLAAAADVRRFRTEAEAAAVLQHPHIVAIHEVGEHDGWHYFSMEYVEGKNLAELVRDKPLPARQAAQLLKSVAEAIEYAHRQGILHRDLKPSNILVATIRSGPSPTEPGSGPKATDDALIPKVTDFGLAKRTEAACELTASGQILGTPSYMPPEQAVGKREEVGPASDVYSLGAILYELLTGRSPFRAETPLETIRLVIESEPVPPRLLNPRVGRDLETICLKCLQKDPRKRYPSASELADDLGRSLRGEPIRARPVGRAERLWRWCRRRPLLAALYAVLLVAAGTLIGVRWWFEHELTNEVRRTNRARAELQIALVREVAGQLDKDLQKLMRIPEMMALAIDEPFEWSESRLGAWMLKVLDQDARLYGTCVAFEPYAYQPDRESFALYAYYDPDNGPKLKQLRPPLYRPYREWDWYRAPLAQGRSLWSEAFDDEGGGDVAMVTYSVPLVRGGKPYGVVTADLSLEYFNKLRDWLDERHLGSGGYGFVLSGTGTFISHPNPDYFRRKMSELDEVSRDAGLVALADRMVRGENGSAPGRDFWTGHACTYLFAPIPSSGWCLVAVIPARSGGAGAERTHDE